MMKKGIIITMGRYFHEDGGEARSNSEREVDQGHNNLEKQNATTSSPDPTNSPVFTFSITMATAALATDDPEPNVCSAVVNTFSKWAGGRKPNFNVSRSFIQVITADTGKR
mmetsp:Transcript_60170/g.105420  ORF Transcript_60170/g.105420 Transcript_60170/m.105420 type:complete len:111 (+) Transcript_60170:2395-2727(+)